VPTSPGANHLQHRPVIHKDRLNDQGGPLSLLLPNASARSKAPRRRANHVTQDTTSNTTDTVEPFTAAQYAQINQLGHDLSNPSAALADLAAMSQVMQEIFSSVEQDEQGGNTALGLERF